MEKSNNFNQQEFKQDLEDLEKNLYKNDKLISFTKVILKKYKRIFFLNKKNKFIKNFLFIFLK